MNLLFSSVEHLSPIVIKALADGYVNRLTFNEGSFLNLESFLSYPILQCLVKPEPCLVSESVVYRVDAPDGSKGLAILDFDANDSF